MPGPQRIRLERRRGFDLQRASRDLNGLSAVTVARPGRWGNPFVIAEVAERYGLDPWAARAKAVAMHGAWLKGTIDPALAPGAPPARDDIVAELRGKNLACWCKPGEPCHADALLAVANGRSTPAKEDQGA